MSIYYCDNCKVYFDDSDMVEMKPDGGYYHWECKKDELQELTHEEILNVLNEKDK